MAEPRVAYGFDIGAAADGTGGKKYYISVKESSYKGFASLLQMKKLRTNDLENYEQISIADATKNLVVIPLRVTFNKGFNTGGNMRRGSAIVYIPRDRIEEAIDGDKGLLKKTYNGHPIVDVYAPRKKVVTY